MGGMGNPNLFVTLHEALHRKGFDRIGTGWENTLTEQLAFLLAADDETRDSVVRLVMGEAAEPATRVETQLTVGGDCPDLAIHLESGRLLLLEHKVGAALGHRQLERYLGIEGPGGASSFLALIALRDTRVPDHVRENERYLHPHDRSHWFWQDIYRAVPAPRSRLGVDYLRASFRDYLELLGLSPSVLTGGWQDLFSSEMSAVPIQEEFGRRLAGVRQWFRSRGFKTVGNYHSGFNAHPTKTSPVHGDGFHFTLSPARARKHLIPPEVADRVESEALRVALVFHEKEPPPLATRIFEALPSPLVDPNGFEWWPTAPYQMTNPRSRLEFVSNLSQFVADDAAIREKLTAGCTAVAECLLGELEAQLPW